MKPNQSELSKLKNIGKTTEKWLNDFDIFTKKDIEKIGPINIYNILKANGYNVSLNLVYALQDAVMDIYWNELPTEMKELFKSEVKNFPNKVY